MNKRVFIILFSVLFFSILIIIIMWIANNHDKDTVDLSSFEINAEYCYDGIPWGSSKDEVLYELNKELSSMDGTNNQIFRAKDIIHGEEATTYLEFHDGFTEISFQFGHLEDSNIEKDYSELETYIAENLVEFYGEYAEKNNFLNAFGKQQRTYKWFKPNADEVDTYIYLSVMYNQETVHYISLAIGKNIDIN